MEVSDKLARKVAEIIGVQPLMSMDAPIVNGHSVREVVVLVAEALAEELGEE